MKNRNKTLRCSNPMLRVYTDEKFSNKDKLSIEHTVIGVYPWTIKM